MTNQPKSSRGLQLALWIAQILLAAGFVWAAGMKWFQPIDRLATMWPWVGQVPAVLVKLTGIVDLLGAVGLILPALVDTHSKLTAWAAMGVVAWMLCAGIFHIVRGEAALIGVNVAFAAIAAFVAWGRLPKAPVPGWPRACPDGL